MMFFIVLFLLLILSVLSREYLFSLYFYLKERAEGKKLDLPRLNSLRADLFHEGKKKFAGLEQIISSWSKKESTIQEHLDYFHQLISQLKTLIEQQRENLLLSSEDIVIYAKLKRRLTGIESKVKRKRFSEKGVKRIGKDLRILQEEIEKNIERATKRFSFNFVDLVKDAVKTVRVEKRDTLEKQRIDIIEDYPEIKKQIRLPYYVYKDWLRVLVNLIRNGVEAIEFQVASRMSQVSEERPIKREQRDKWVKVSVVQSDEKGLLVRIEDNGMGMDEETKNNFYKRGFSKKDTGQGLGVTEESFELIHRYGGWEIESQIGKGTKITIEVEKEKAEKERIEIEGKRTILQRAFPTPARVVLVGLLLVIVGLGILLSVNKYLRFWEDWNPAFVDISEADSTIAIIKNSHDKTIWTKKFDSKIAKDCLAVGDIDGDKKNEVALGITNNQSKSGYVCCLDHNEKELWRFEVGRPGVYPIGELFYATDIVLADLNSDKEEEIIVNSICVAWYPDQIVILDKRGETKGEYWHSGNLSFQFIKDMDKDGELEIVFAGINNKLERSPAVVVLDYRKVKGQSPPYLAKGIPKAEEKFYVRIPAIKELVENVKSYPQADIKYTGSNKGYDEYTIISPDGLDIPGRRYERQYFVDQDFNIKDLYLQGNFLNEWKQLMERGVVNYEITDSVMESWKKFEIWRNGVKVQ